MKFKAFLEQNGYFVEMANPNKGLTDVAMKVKLMPDDKDRDLYLKFTATYPDPERNALATKFLNQYSLRPSKQLAAKVIRARYGIASSHGSGKSDKVQHDAVSHKVYFKNPSASNATLVVGDTEIPDLDIKFSDLMRKLESYPIGNGEHANIKKDMTRFTHPAIQGKVAPRDTEGNPVKGKQTNGINAATLGLTGHPSEIGWALSYHKTGISTKKLTADEEKFAQQSSSIDTSKDKSDEEKESIKKLTASGNNFITNILFNPQEVETEIKDSSGQPMTNKQILSLAKKTIARQNDRSIDKDDILHAFAMLLRNKYGQVVDSENAEMFIYSLVKNAIRDVKEDLGIGRKAGEDVKHGKKYGLKTSTIEGDQDASGSEKPAKNPTIADLKRRLALTKPEYKGSETREDVPDEPEEHGVRTYKTTAKTPDEEIEDIKRSREDIESFKSRMKKDVVKPSTGIISPERKADDDTATQEDLLARRNKMIARIRKQAGIAEPASKPQSSMPVASKASALDRLRQKFRVA